MPTQDLPRSLIRARWGMVDDFFAGPDDNHISHGVPAGHVTDDTDQAVLLGRALVAGGGRIDLRGFADELLAWERRMRDAGSLDLLGPSTRRALDLVAQGVDPRQTGSAGTTNGAAMRIAPVGVAVPTAPLDGLVAAVHDASRATHDTGIAIAGASAVAAAVSAGVDGASVGESLEIAVEAARLGGTRGHWAAGADVAARIDAALAAVRGLAAEAAVDTISRVVGTSVATQESVPAAFAIVAVWPDDAWAACRAAASVGGDCDTIAAMAGAMLGARLGASAFPDRVLTALAAANPDLALEALADDLLTLRDTRG